MPNEMVPWWPVVLCFQVAGLALLFFIAWALWNNVVAGLKWVARRLHRSQRA